MGERGILQTLDRGLQVLVLLTKESLGPSEIASRLNFERTAVHRILRTLVIRGFVEQASDGCYRANMRFLLELSGRLEGSRKREWIGLAAASLEVLRSETGLSANLCVPSGKEMVYIMQSLATSMLAVNSPPGTRRPLYASSVGKAYLGSLPYGELDQLLSTLEFIPFTPSTILSAVELKANLIQGQARGYYTDFGEINPEIICLAAPIRDNTGRPIASIGVSGPRTNSAFNKIDGLGKLVQREATMISAFLGFIETQAEKTLQLEQTVS